MTGESKPKQDEMVLYGRTFRGTISEIADAMAEQWGSLPAKESA